MCMEWHEVADLAHSLLELDPPRLWSPRLPLDSASWFPSMWRNSEVWWLIKRKKLRTCPLMYHGKNACPETETVGEVNNQPNVFEGPSAWFCFVFRWGLKFLTCWSFTHPSTTTAWIQAAFSKCYQSCKTTSCLGMIRVGHPIGLRYDSGTFCCLLRLRSKGPAEVFGGHFNTE